MSIKKDFFAPLALGLGATRRAAVLLLVMMLTMAQTAWADGISYLDATGTQQSCTTYTTVESSSTFWNSGWFVVNSNTTISDRITVSGTVNLILTNNATLTASKGITVGSDATLNIYAQTDDEATMGALVASGVNDNQQYNAGIGGVDNTAAGTITINGGKINATGKVGAGIGSGGQSGATVGTITINGGIVTAQDGDGWGAGIGGGGILGKASTINLNGGIINAAGIGSGYMGGDCSITVNISDGIRKIVATPVQGGACIGKGEYASGSVTVNFISGGNIVTGDDKDAVFYDTDEGSERQIRTKALNHTVTMSDNLKAHITVSTELAITGETVTLTLGTAVDASTLKVNDGTSDLTLTDAGNRNYTFTMPAGNVTVTATLLQTYPVNLPANMEVVGATNAADANGKYITGTTVNFKASFPCAASNVSDGTNTLEPDANGIYSVTIGTSDVTISATIERSATIDLTDAPGDFAAINNDVLTGSTSHTVTIANGASITLNDATITGGIVCAGTAEITLVGTNSVTGASYKAGIQVGGSGTTLTIKGNGSLTANGGDQSAGIGLSRAWKPANDVIGGDIIIEGGNITANGSVNDQWGAGIGTGVIKGGTGKAMLGTITIKGGSVKATGGSEADGIGTGYTYYGCTNTIGTVTIYDGIDKVDASSIRDFGSVVYKHDETDVTANKIDYFTIIENGNRRVIAPKDDTDYTITIANGIEHGTLTGAATAKYMEKVTITATPALGYRFSRLVVKDAQNNDVASTDNSFFMPKSNVTVSAVFEQGVHGTTEFAWGYYEDDFVKEATIYDGVTTVNIQKTGQDVYTGTSYRIRKYEGDTYYNFRLDNNENEQAIPFTGTGEFVYNYNPTAFYVTDNNELGFYDITMTDVGNGKWNVSILKTAGQMDVVPDQTYTGSAITPEPTVIAGSLNLTKGTDYVYSYTNNTNVGTAKVRAIFQGTYAWLGSVEKEFTIVPKSVTNNDISITIPSQEWTGSELTPVITVTDGETELTLNTDYTVTPPSGPVQNAGNYTYTITGMGNYAGSREATFTISLTLDPADISVNAEGTEYTIHTAGGWNAFCDLLAANTKGYFSGKTVKLDADIAVSRMAGGHEFTGTFDGGGHTLTLAYGTADAPVDAQFIAPFVETAADNSNQPVFRNLTIDGTIYASNPQAAEHYHVGGLIGHLFGDVTIEHCNSLVHITAPGGAGGFVGLCEHTAMFTDCLSSAVITSPGGNNSGFVGWSRASGHAISFDGCTFNGKLLQQDGNGSHNGGFIGWTGSNKTVTFTNCLCAPATLASGETMASGNSATFARGWNATTTATNSYYTQTFGDAQGTKPIVTASKPSNIGDVGTAYNVSGITAYGNGLLYGSDYYCVNSQFGEIALAYSGSSLTATIDGTSVATVSIPEDVTVSSVTYNRAFTMGRPSTVMLPFSKDVNEISGGTFYTFGGVEKKNNKWEATMNEVMGSLTANTPYLFVPTGTSLTFTGGATLNTTGGGNCLASDTGGWEFHGTYTNKVWDEVVTHDYGFAALSGTSADDKSVEAGQFVRLTTGASAKPMRCYLSYVGVPAQARAMTRGAAATNEELPQSIIVRLVGSNGETTAIGTIDTKTGEMTFFDEQSGRSATTGDACQSKKAERDSEAWYTLDGVRLSGKPTKKGLYINNGKKIVIK